MGGTVTVNLCLEKLWTSSAAHHLGCILPARREKKYIVRYRMGVYRATWGLQPYACNVRSIKKKYKSHISHCKIQQLKFIGRCIIKEFIGLKPNADFVWIIWLFKVINNLVFINNGGPNLCNTLNKNTRRGGRERCRMFFTRTAHFFLSSVWHDPSIWQVLWTRCSLSSMMFASDVPWAAHNQRHKMWNKKSFIKLWNMAFRWEVKLLICRDWTILHVCWSTRYREGLLSPST